MRRQRSFAAGLARGAFHEALIAIANANDGTGNNVDLCGDICGNRVFDLRIEH